MALSRILKECTELSAIVYRIDVVINAGTLVKAESWNLMVELAEELWILKLQPNHRKLKLKWKNS